MAKTLSLREVKTFDAVCDLPRDHYDLGDWCIMTDGNSVWIFEQKLGEPRKQEITVPKRVFDQLLARYEKPQNVKAR